MANLSEVVNALFKKGNWSDITSEDKELNFFIINRFLCKRYPEKAQLFNSKLIDKVSAMDTWYFFLQKEYYPKWFWSKSTSTKSKSEISESEVSYLLNEFDISKEDLDMILKYYPEVVKEEISYYRDVKKQDK